MKNCKGVTLMMVLLTVVMLAIMTGLVLRHASNTLQKAKVERFKAEVTAVEKAISLKYRENSEATTMNWSQYHLTEAQVTQLEDLLETDEMQYIEYYTTSYFTNPSTELPFANVGWVYITSEQFKTDFDLDYVTDDYFVFISIPVVIGEHGIKVNGETKHTIFGVQ